MSQLGDGQKSRWVKPATFIGRPGGNTGNMAGQGTGHGAARPQGSDRSTGGAVMSLPTTSGGITVDNQNGHPKGRGSKRQASPLAKGYG